MWFGESEANVREVFDKVRYFVLYFKLNTFYFTLLLFYPSHKLKFVFSACNYYTNI